MTLTHVPVYRPLFPESNDQGDPYILAIPEHVNARYRFYTYTTGIDPDVGRAFRVYASHDLVTWDALGASLEAYTTRAHWAPCVRYVPGLDRPYVMLYSRAMGLGEQAHVGHVLRRADSTSPEGPFTDSGHTLTPDIDFAIDPDVYHLPDGSLKVAFAMDFVSDAPLGTGIVEASISDDLTRIVGPIETLARARHDWHVYDPARIMPWKRIPGINWGHHTVRWHTVEAPVGGLVSPNGRRVYLYSGGCFFNYYALGALVEDDHGSLVDITDGTKVLLGPEPTRGFYGPGHCSWLRLPDGSDYLMLHARFGTPDAPRQMCLAPLAWNDEGLPCVVAPDPGVQG